MRHYMAVQPAVSSPPGPAPSSPTKVAGRRIAAWFIDIAIAMMLVVGYAMATFTNTEMRSVFEAELQCQVINDLSDDFCFSIDETVFVGTSGDTAIAVLLWFGWILLWTVILPSITGWSVGKLITGLRVVNGTTFAKAGIGANLVRALVWMLDAFPYFLPGVGGIVMLATARRQRLGDLAANTLVVRAEFMGRPPLEVSVASTSGPPPPSGPAFSPPPPTATPPPPTAAPPPPTATSTTPPPPTGTPHRYQPPPPNATSSSPSAPPPVFPPPTSAPHPEAKPSTFADVPISAATPPAVAPDPATSGTAAPGGPATPPTEPPAATPRAGVDAPMWDEARDTYIQWDPDLLEWMEWSEARGRWIPISR